MNQIGVNFVPGTDAAHLLMLHRGNEILKKQKDKSFKNRDDEWELRDV